MPDIDSVTFWCTCPPGLEDVARDEAAESLANFGIESIEATRGRLVGQLNFPSAGEDQSKLFQSLLNLRLAANHFLVFHECQLFDDAEDGVKLEKIESLDRLIDLVPQANWQLAMNAWRSIFYEPDGRHSQIGRVGHEPVPNYELTRDKPIIDGVNQTANQQENETIIKTKDPNTLSFRCTCYRTGSNHSFQSMEAAAAVGAAVQDYFGWNVDLKNFDVEVVLWIEGPLVRLCLSLNRVCMDFRGQLVDIGSTALRSTIAAGMLRLCQPKPGEILCDCMCGCGSIPLEAWTTQPNCWLLGGDCHPVAIEKSLANVENWCQRWDRRPPVELIHWNLRQFPMRSGIVDVFLADLPFGKRLGSKRDNATLYPAALTAMARCSVPGTGRACLLTADRGNLSRAVNLLCEYWTVARRINIGIGGITASIVLLTRTSASFVATFNSSSKVSKA